jgi:hypothetical protein
MFDNDSARHGNGLDADTWVPLVDVEPDVGERLLVALRQARIPAYVEPAGEPDRRRLFVASADRGDARIVVEAATRDDGAVQPLDVLEGVDTEAEFNALIGEWDIDTLSAVRAAERDLTREDSDWRARLDPGYWNNQAADEDEEEHYVPPAPPPLPRLSGATIFALFLIAVSIVVLAIGDSFGLESDFSFLLGVAGILVGSGLLIMRLRARPPDDEDDDGAII